MMRAGMGTLVVFFSLYLSAYAHFMSSVWPQKQFEEQTAGPLKSPKRVLIAGTTSDFKLAVMKAVADSLAAESVFVKMTDYKRLKKEDAGRWQAIVLTNTCIGWDIENRARSFIETHPDYRAFVLLTTSGDPDSCCPSAKLPRGIDAVSAASTQSDTAAVIGSVLEKIMIHLRGDHPAPPPRTEPDTTSVDVESGATKKHWK